MDFLVAMCEKGEGRLPATKFQPFCGLRGGFCVSDNV